METQQQQQIEELAAVEIAAIERISGWWKVADIHPQYPATSEMVVSLLAGMEYLVNLATIHKAIDEGWLFHPIRKAGRFEWYACDILAMGQSLESRRLWKPLSRLHDWKKSEFSKSLEAAAAAGKGPESVIVDISSFSVSELLILMVQCNHRNAREMFYECIKLHFLKKHLCPLNRHFTPIERDCHAANDIAKSGGFLDRLIPRAHLRSRYGEGWKPP